tara:strand:+ start:126 stop:281 length:156 start_codon:yes stop_codon:yes gene_type:complete
MQQVPLTYLETSTGRSAHLSSKKKEAKKTYTRLTEPPYVDPAELVQIREVP